VAVDVARGQRPTTAVTIPNGVRDVPAIFEKIISVDRDNLQATVVADGFHPAAALK
jgi:D-xylose transport system substrate-binding protein